MEEINRCISLDSTSDFAYLIRSEIYEDAGNYTQALCDIEPSLQIEPFSPEYNMKRALLLEKMGDKDSIQDAFLKTVHCPKNDDYLKALVSASKLRTHGYLDSALVCLNYLIEFRGNYAGILKERGEAYLKKKY